ncbi:MAG: hypothetical protein ACTMKU_08435, partial [Actinomycetaceae bacterium]
LVDALTGLARSGMGILLVEQFVEVALGVGTTAHVMHRGRIVRSERCSVLREERASLLSPYYLGGRGDGPADAP